MYVLLPASVWCAMSEINFEGMWRVRVVPLAKQAPHIFKSQYYAHRDAAEEMGRLHILDEPTLKAWKEFTNEKIRGMSNYAGD